MKVVAVIPARMGSSRFPGKPIAKILGLPMIEHVYRRTAMSAGVGQVLIATCDEEIARATRDFGGEAVMTQSTHERASDRAAEVARSLDADVVVMVQGDEPMLSPDMVDAALMPMRGEPDVDCVNLASRIRSPEEHRDPNTVKVVMDRAGNALYFSREPIPTAHVRGFDALAVYKQVCVMPFRRAALLEYARLSPTPLEIAESIDMMRFLEHGRRVRMVETEHDVHAVDTPEDLKRVERLLADDPLTGTYAGK